MSLIAKSSGTTMAPIPEGVYSATCYLVADLGTQYSAAFDKASHKVVVGWEIPEQRIEVDRDGKKVNLPRAISSRYTLSLGEKAILRRDLNAWRGRAFTEAELQGFDLKKLVGAACQLQIIHATKDGKTFGNVGTIMALPKGVKPPPPENETLFFSLDDLGDGPPTMPANMPEWIAKLVKASPEWEKLTLKARNKGPVGEPTAPVVAAITADDDVPF